MEHEAAQALSDEAVPVGGRRESAAWSLSAAQQHERWSAVQEKRRAAAKSKSTLAQRQQYLDSRAAKKAGAAAS